MNPARGAAAILTVVTVAAVVAGHAAGSSAGPVSFYAFHAVAAPSFSVLGVTILARRPRNPIGWLFVAIGLASAVTVVAASFASHPLLAWIEQWSLPVALGLIPFVLLLFPDGHLPSVGWRSVGWVVAVGLAITVTGLAVATGLAPRAMVDLAAPTPASAERAFQVAAIGLLAVLLGTVAAVGSLVVRWRRADSQTRLQVKALALGAATIPVGIALDFFFGLPMVWLALGAVLPAAVTAAILNYRLYDIDLVLNRSLVYGTLTVLVVAAYVTVVTVSTPLLPVRDERAPSVVALAVVALLFQPARSRVQGAVNHLLYGDRDDPYAVLTRLSRRLERAVDPLAALPQVTESITEALKLPFAAIELADQDSGRPVVSHGRPGIEPETFAMTYQREVVGRLLVSPRSAASPFTQTERQLLRDLATQAGMAAHAMQLTTALQRSRERLVRSREEERRRLRRELHDGLGPALAGMTMQVGAARAVLAAQGGEADAVLGGLERQLQACVGEVRRVVDDLRPAVLDQLGVAGAVRSHAASFATPGGPDVEITVTARNLGELPAAVEVAAFRIVTEAMTNTIRHAAARRCHIVLARDGVLTVEVTDDGQGLPDQPPPGIGLSSMRERAEELGGSFTATRMPTRGTRVRATIPLEAP